MDPAPSTERVSGQPQFTKPPKAGALSAALPPSSLVPLKAKGSLGVSGLFVFLFSVNPPFVRLLPTLLSNNCPRLFLFCFCVFSSEDETQGFTCATYCSAEQAQPLNTLNKKDVDGRMRGLQ